MSRTELLLLTLVAERVLENRLVELILGSGATGCTVTDARGEGSHHMGSHSFEDRNVKIETVVGRDVADDILDAVAEQYLPHYGVVAYATAVSVVGGDKYIGEIPPDRSP